MYAVGCWLLAVGLWPLAFGSDPEISRDYGNFIPAQSTHQPILEFGIFLIGIYDSGILRLFGIFSHPNPHNQPNPPINTSTHFGIWNFSYWNFLKSYLFFVAK